MTLRSLLFLLVFGALAAFVLVNWPVLNDPTTLSLAFAEVQAPLGVVMLGFIVLVTVLFLAYIVYLQMSGLLETRRHGKEIQSQRQLADQAEASRFTELRGFLEAEFATEFAMALKVEEYALTDPAAVSYTHLTLPTSDLV